MKKKSSNCVFDKSISCTWMKAGKLISTHTHTHTLHTVVSSVVLTGLQQNIPSVEGNQLQSI